MDNLLVAAHLTTIEAVERQGVALLDAGANPARMASGLYAVLTRLQVEGRFLGVDVAKLEDVWSQIVRAQEEDARS
jgi:hypothetical protein